MAALTAARCMAMMWTAESVRALLAGTKDVTRRPVKNEGGVCAACWEEAVPHNVEQLHEPDGKPNIAGALFGTEPYLRVPSCVHIGDTGGGRVRCRYRVGDRIWGKETWGYVGGDEYLYLEDRASVGYEATHLPLEPILGGRWRSKFFMRRWMARLHHDVVSVRLERLLALTDADAQREGVRPFFERFTSASRDQCITTGERAAAAEYRASYAVAWDAMHGRTPGLLWQDNPWVWRIELRPASP